MWFDVVVLVVLAFFGLRGAVKGVIFQLASIAGIALCLACAGTSAKLVGPHINLQPPLNQWVILFGTYLVCTFVAFSFAKSLNSAVEKAHLGELNRHLGFLFGVLKGAILCLVLAYMVVTFSPTARDSLKSSRVAPYMAQILDKIQPLMPDRLHESIGKFLAQLDRPEVPENPGLFNPANPFEPLPGGGPVVGNDIRFMNQGVPGTGVSWPGTGTSPGGQTAPSTDTQDFWTQIRSSFGTEAQRQIAGAWTNADPKTRQKIENDLMTAIRTTPPDQWGNLQSRIIESGQRGAFDLVGDWFSRQVGGTPAQSPVSVPTAGSPYSQPFAGTPGSTPSVPYTNPPAGQPYSGTNPSTPTYQNPNSGPAGGPSYSNPASVPQYTGPSNVPATAQDRLLNDIVTAQSPFAPIQQKLREQIAGLVAGIPQSVGTAVLTDWRADLYRERDPDPGTDATTAIETRVMRQLQRAGVPETQVSRDVQQRLNSFRVSSESGGDLR